MTDILTMSMLCLERKTGRGDNSRITKESTTPELRPDLKYFLLPFMPIRVGSVGRKNILFCKSIKKKLAVNCSVN